MKEPPDTENPCTVHPTSELSPTHHYSDMAMTELFTAHVRLFNQEVAGLWQRYNVMLLANSAIFSFFAMREHYSNQEVLIILALGLALCTENRPVNPFRYFHVERQKKNMPRILTRVVLASVVIIFFTSYIALAYVRYQ
jgi:hypothetical protein